MNTSQTLRPEERRAASDPAMTGSKALIESFLQEGVETVFGYPGGAIIPVYDALYDYRDRLRHILACVTSRAPCTPHRAMPASAAASGSVW